MALDENGGLYATSCLIVNPADIRKEKVSNIFIWHDGRWSQVGTGGANGDIRALACIGSDLYATGDFTRIGGFSARRIARWDGKVWSPLGKGLNGPGWTMLASNGKLFVGGHFTKAGDSSVSNIACWNKATWAALGLGLNHTVKTIKVYGNAIIAGGQFYMSGIVRAEKIAKWDGSSWADMGVRAVSLAVKSIDETASISAMETSGSVLFANGLLQARANSPERRFYPVLAWNGLEWKPLDFPGARYDLSNSPYSAGQELPRWSVHVMTLCQGVLLAGGRFPAQDSQGDYHLAQWDGTRWSSIARFSD
ncbi:MAG: hypothetical protein K1X53_06885 [Candidatus Sumerlaeaceae bacterium]|nr:hypothetical protein [Candidatus Sumerlaeaceae bacterium]